MSLMARPPEDAGRAPPALPVRSAAEERLDPFVVAFIAFSPFDQFAGQTSPCSSTYCTASSKRMTSSSCRPIGAVADVLRHDGAALVDDEGAAVGDPFGLVEHVVRARDLLGEVGDDGVGDPLNAAVLLRGVEPGQVAVHRVNGKPTTCALRWLNSPSAS